MDVYGKTYSVDGWPITKNGKPMSKEDVIAELNDLRAKLSESERDAERYRWLRESAKDVWYGDELIDNISSGFKVLDKAIDAAIQQTKMRGGDDVI